MKITHVRLRQIESILDHPRALFEEWRAEPTDIQ